MVYFGSHPESHRAFIHEATFINFYPKSFRPSIIAYCWHYYCGEGNGTPTPVLLPGKSHGRRSLVLQSLGSLQVGHNWVASLSLFTFIIGEGNGNPLQCSCLENPRDGGAWWAAVYGVAQSQTWLKWLSSSSSINIDKVEAPLPRIALCFIYMCVYICTKSLQLCPILCDSVHYSLPVSSVQGFFKQEYWGGLPCPSPENFPTQGSNLHLLYLNCIGRWTLNR